MGTKFRATGLIFALPGEGRWNIMRMLESSRNEI